MSDANDWNKSIIDEFRANAGKVGGMFAGRTPLLLHTIGAKSGKEPVDPVAYVTDGDRARDYSPRKVAHQPILIGTTTSWLIR